VHIDRSGHEILETTAVVTGEGFIEARFTVDLPVRKDTIAGNFAADLFMNVIPHVVRGGLMFRNIDGDGLADWIEANEDADAARLMLAERGLVAFIADGSVLSGKKEGAAGVAFKAPEELAVTIELPNRGTTRGMGIPKGITLVAGGYGAGKTTLLKAIEVGVYNHIPGDGRELAVTVGDAVGVRTEEGRRVENVDISAFFAPSEGNDTRRYSARSATVSASQAANLVEAVEIGASLLILDEDTSAAELITRDGRIQALVSPNGDTITPLVDILPALRDRMGISAVVAMSSGDFLDIADTVILMNRYAPASAAVEVRRILEEFPSRRISRAGDFPPPEPRCPLSFSLEPERGSPENRQRPHGRGFIQYGDEFIDCTKIGQLVSISQERAISRGIALVHRLMEGSKSLREAIDRVMERVNTVGLDTLSGRLMGDLASFRAHELAAAVNRLRRLKVK
jgi:predicted ABC-class ATPase